MAKAMSSYGVYLMWKDDGTWKKLVDIKDYPDLGGAPEMLDTTTLSDPAFTFVPGIQANDAKTFTANYNLTDYNTLKAMEGAEYDFAVYFGHTIALGVATPDGTKGKFEFKGELSVYATGAGVNAVPEMMITIAPSTPIKQSVSS